MTLLLASITAVGCTAPRGFPESIERINVIEARKLVQSGHALLVCSYDDDRCKEILLEGAMLKSEFESRLPTLPKTQPIVFYCA
jgi:hypothetical protein